MKKINLEIKFEEPINNECEHDNAIRVLTSVMFELEDKIHSLEFKTLSTFNELNNTSGISQEEKLKSKFDKASDWVEKESNLDNQNKEFLSKWINKDLPFYFFQCNQAVTTTNNLEQDQDIESWENEDTGDFSGVCVRTLSGNVTVKYDFNKLSESFDNIVEAFEKYHGFPVPKEVLSIIDMKETVDKLNKIDLDKDRILKFFELYDSNVSIAIENNGDKIDQSVSDIVKPRKKASKFGRS